MAYDIGLAARTLYREPEKYFEVLGQVPVGSATLDRRELVAYLGPRAAAGIAVMSGKVTMGMANFAKHVGPRDLYAAGPGPLQLIDNIILVSQDHAADAFESSDVRHRYAGLEEHTRQLLLPLGYPSAPEYVLRDRMRRGNDTARFHTVRTMDLITRLIQPYPKDEARKILREIRPDVKRILNRTAGLLASQLEALDKAIAQPSRQPGLISELKEEAFVLSEDQSLGRWTLQFTQDSLEDIVDPTSGLTVRASIDEFLDSLLTGCPAVYLGGVNRTADTGYVAAERVTWRALNSRRPDTPAGQLIGLV